MSDANTICDELAVLIEPDPSQRDDGRMRPYAVGYDVGKLYLWPRRDRFERAGTRGDDQATDIVRFEINAAWVVDKRGEVDDIDREVSDAVTQRAESMADVLREHPTGTTYRDVKLVEVDYTGLPGHESRGFLARIEGWTFRS